MTGDDAQVPPLRPPGCRPMFHRVLPAQDMAVRQALADMRARFAGQDGDAVDRAELVLAEVMNNIAQHGTGRGKDHLTGVLERSVTIHLAVTWHDGGLSCAVTDDGPPLPADCLLADAPPAHDDPLTCGGFGWPIIRALTQSLFHFREGSRNLLCFNVPLAEEDTAGQRQTDVA